MKSNLFLFILLSYSTGCFSQLFDSDKLIVAKLDSIIIKEFNNNDPGGSVFIQKAGRILYSRSFGLSDIVRKTNFNDKTVSNIGSITKTFVAYAILILQKQGKLSIDDSIIKYFPDFKNKEIAKKVKIRHLLTHTSGLPDNRNIDQDSAFYLTANDVQNFAPLKQTDTLEFEPGTNWKYSNPGYNGLAMIIEKVSGMKWQRFVEKYIFEPAGMVHSKITDGSFPEKGVAHGYRKSSNHFEEYDYGEYPTFTAAGNGGVWSSIEDLRKYVYAIKNCLFVDCNTIAFSEKIWYPEKWMGEQPPSQGFSWFIYEPKNVGEYKVINHSGGQGGFHAHLFIIPEPDITIIWLTNNDRSLTSIIIEPLIKLGYLK